MVEINASVEDKTVIDETVLNVLDGHNLKKCAPGLKKLRCASMQMFASVGTSFSLVCLLKYAIWEWQTFYRCMR